MTLPSFSGSITCLGADTICQHVLACGCSDGTVRQLDCRLPAQQRQLATLGDFRGGVCRLMVQPAPDGRHLAAAGDDGRVLVWDTRLFRDPLVDFQLITLNDGVEGYISNYMQL